MAGDEMTRDDTDIEKDNKKDQENNDGNNGADDSIQLFPEGEVNIYRDAKRRGIYPPLFTDPEGDSCFSIYQIRWIKKRFFNFFF